MKAFEYEIATPERLIKFDKSPDFRGNRVSRRRPSPAALSGPVPNCRAARRRADAPRNRHRSHRTVSSSDGLRPARAPRRLSAANRRQHRCALPPISIIVLVRRIIRPGFVNP
ncbi:hypothetical protein [Burkholderia ambifaria]|uniref:hypothetical protein n=1 Tax=Burkholderia ambifaria TaxID=152480 RepID=UPI00158E1667|nr:hypothetical protein [Burkholderia ambifaria]WDR86873.1 hypothetical protein OR986_11045 [Burkholderia ambifaria]WDR99550.1 hypothetical protein OR985_16010 [Burkholderia ambifaria]